MWCILPRLHCLGTKESFGSCFKRLQRNLWFTKCTVELNPCLLNSCLSYCMLALVALVLCSGRFQGVQCLTPMYCMRVFLEHCVFALHPSSGPWAQEISSTVRGPFTSRCLTATRIQWQQSGAGTDEQSGWHVWSISRILARPFHCASAVPESQLISLDYGAVPGNKSFTGVIWLQIQYCEKCQGLLWRLPSQDVFFIARLSITGICCIYPEQNLKWIMAIIA